jgi:hypothetical protein
VNWVNAGGTGHAVVGVTEGDEWKYLTACGLEAPQDAEGIGTKNLFERPYGVDTHPECHDIVKGWAADPTTAPPGLFETPDELPSSRPLNAEERAAAIRGSSLTPVPHNPPETAPAAGAAPAGQKRAVPEPGSDEDMGWPDEPEAGLPTVEGAVVVPPRSRSSKRHRSTVVADDSFEIDSD